MVEMVNAFRNFDMTGNFLTIYNLLLELVKNNYQLQIINIEIIIGVS